MNVVRTALPNDFLQTKRTDAPVLWVASNCDAWSDRHVYVKELMKYIQVDSYGSCLNNKPSPKDPTEREQIMKHYKFYLAIENSNCDDYVTEKLFDTFQFSAVPIIDGPNSYEGYLPNNRSAIRMDAYPDPRRLADYINYLNKNDTAYLEYFSFRQQDQPEDKRLNQRFYQEWSDWDRFNLKTIWCSVCLGVLPWQQQKDEAKKNQQQLSLSSVIENDDRANYLRTDNSCRMDGKWKYIYLGPPYLPNWKPSLPDEFTRPWHENHQRLADYSIRPVSSSTVGTLDESSRMTWLIFSFYCLFFTAFMFFMLYRRKDRKRSSPMIPLS
ncbi:hypothetical protein BJ944DRAFT_169396 [Cunninghamella echinulata]|nr:hypothetical protein BJ944DRAFT_169396 [Cunninghamella echinulata]